MTEPIETPTASEPEPRSEAWAATADEPDDVDDEGDPITDMRQVRKLRNEAKRLRHLLREEQANRASEATRHAADREADLAKLAEYETRAVAAAASTVLIDPEDLYRYTDEETQASFNDEFGAITADHVIAAAKKLAAEKPHLARPQNTPPPSNRPIEGLRSGAAPAVEKKPADWSTALRGG